MTSWSALLWVLGPGTRRRFAVSVDFGGVFANLHWARCFLVLSFSLRLGVHHNVLGLWGGVRRPRGKQAKHDRSFVHSALARHHFWPLPSLGDARALCSAHVCATHTPRGRSSHCCSMHGLSN